MNKVLLLVVTLLFLSSGYKVHASGDVTITNEDLLVDTETIKDIDVDVEKGSTFTVSVPVLRPFNSDLFEKYAYGEYYCDAGIRFDGDIRADEQLCFDVDEDVIMTPEGGRKSDVIWKAHIVPNINTGKGYSVSELVTNKGLSIILKPDRHMTAGLWKGYLHLNVSIEEYGSLLTEDQFRQYVCSDLNATSITIPKYISVDGKQILVRGLDKSALKDFTKLTDIYLETDDTFQFGSVFMGSAFESDTITIHADDILVKMSDFSEMTTSISYDGCQLMNIVNPYNGYWTDDEYSTTGCHFHYNDTDTVDVENAIYIQRVYGKFTDLKINPDIKYIDYYAFQHAMCDKLIVPNFTYSFGTHNSFFAEIAAKEVECNNYYIGQQWFRNCPVLEKVVLTDNVEYIGKEAFAGCTKLTEVIIPESVKYIDSSAFNGTPFLTNLKKGVENVYINGIWVAYGDLYVQGSSYEVPAAFTSVGSDIISDKVKSLSFEKSSNSITFANNLTSITSLDATGRNVGMFNTYLPNLTYAKLGGNTRTAGNWQSNTKMTDVDLVDGVELIGNYAFNHATGYADTTFVIPKTVYTIGSNSPFYVYPGTGWSTHVFYDFGKDSIYDSDGDTTSQGFSEFVVAEDSPYYTDVDGILYTKDLSALVAIPRAMEFENGIYEMPDETVILGELTFSRNKNIKEVVLGDSYQILPSKQSIIDKYDKHTNSVLNEGNSLSIAIYQYSDVQKYTVKDTNPNYKSIDGIVYTKDGKELVAIPDHYQGDIVIPEGCTTIRENAFWIDYDAGIGVHDGITSISIPASMSNIHPRQLEYLNNRFGTGKVSVAVGNSVYINYLEWVRGRGLIKADTIGKYSAWKGICGSYWRSSGGSNAYNVGCDSNAARAAYEPIYLPEGTYRFRFNSSIPVKYNVIFAQSNGKVSSTATNKCMINHTTEPAEFTVEEGGRFAFISAYYWDTENNSVMYSKMTETMATEILDSLIIEKRTD